LATTPAAQAPAYQGLRVIELADDPGGEFCGKLLAQMGADVIKVEPPGGASSRSEGPYARGQEDPNRSLPFWHYNIGKRSVVLDLTGDSERARLRDLLAGADVFIYSGQPAVLAELGLTSAELVRVNARRPSQL
jgi:crotonobetainyl-CoA:carnitine CoA-transferase CaiB-like acyl-CoA transferase